MAEPTVFLAGAAGFIGRHMARCFVDDGYHVLALIHRRNNPVLEQFQARGALHILQQDATAPELKDRVVDVCRKHDLDLQYVVNAAGHASDVGPRDLFERSNFELPCNLARLAMATAARRFVHVSTTDVYGLRDFHGETEYELPFQNNRHNFYPQFKIQTERWMSDHLPAERYSILRPAAVWGPDDPTLTQRFADFLAWSPWIVHFGRWRGSNRWPLAHVRNVAMAAVAACRQPEAAGQAVNILDRERTSVDDFYRLIAAVYHPQKHYRTVCLPLWTGKAYGSLVSGVSRISGRPQPLGDPSLYAVYSLSANLDFDNQRFVALLAKQGKEPFPQADAISELRKHHGTATSR